RGHPPPHCDLLRLPGRGRSSSRGQAGAGGGGEDALIAQILRAGFLECGSRATQAAATRRCRIIVLNVPSSRGIQSRSGFSKAIQRFSGGRMIRFFGAALLALAMTTPAVPALAQPYPAPNRGDGT